MHLISQSIPGLRKTTQRANRGQRQNAALAISREPPAGTAFRARPTSSLRLSCAKSNRAGTLPVRPHEEDSMRFAIALATLVTAVPAFAANSGGIKGTGTYGTAGCGLGSLAFGNQAGGGQILAATTNGLFFNQTFAMTSGTSNCGPGLLAMGTKNFVEANREVVAKDISRGQGEAIGALAVINACSDSRAVGAALQKSFSKIFPTASATDEDVTAAILKTLHSDPSLGCGRI